MHTIKGRNIQKSHSYSLRLKFCLPWQDEMNLVGVDRPLRKPFAAALQQSADESCDFSPMR